MRAARLHARRYNQYDYSTAAAAVAAAPLGVDLKIQRCTMQSVGLMQRDGSKHRFLQASVTFRGTVSICSIWDFMYLDLYVVEAKLKCQCNVHVFSTVPCSTLDYSYAFSGSGFVKEEDFSFNSCSYLQTNKFFMSRIAIFLINLIIYYI